MGVLQDAWDWFTDAVEDAADWAEEAVDDVTEFIEETLEDIENLVDQGIDDLEEMVEYLEDQAEAMADYADTLYGTAADMYEEMAETLEELAEETQEALDDAVEWAEQAAEDAAELAEDAAEEVVDWGREAIEDAGQWAGQALQDAGEAIADAAYDVVNFDDGFHLDIGILEVDASKEDGFRFELGTDGVNLNGEVDIDSDGDWNISGGVETPILHAEAEAGVEDGKAHVGADWGVDMSIGWIDIEGEQGWEWQQTDGGWRFDAYNEGEVGIFGVSVERDRSFGVGYEDGEASAYYTDEVALNLGDDVELRVGGGVKVTTDGTLDGTDTDTGGFVRGQAFGEEAQAGEQIDTGVEEELPEIVQNQQDWIDEKLAEDGPTMVDEVQSSIEERLERDRRENADDEPPAEDDTGDDDDAGETGPAARPRADLADGPGGRPDGRRAPSDAFDEPVTEPTPDEAPARPGGDGPPVAVLPDEPEAADEPDRPDDDTGRDRPRPDRDGDRPDGDRRPNRDAFEDLPTRPPSDATADDDKPTDDTPNDDGAPDEAPTDDRRRPERPDRPREDALESDDLIAPQRGDGGRVSTIGDPSHSPEGVPRPDGDGETAPEPSLRPVAADDARPAIAQPADAPEPVEPIEIADPVAADLDADEPLGAPRGDLFADDRDGPLGAGPDGLDLDE